MSLHNKTIVITGGGSGLGADAAKAARAAGANIVLNGRSKDKLVAVANEIDPTGKNVAIVDGDIGDPTTAERVIRAAVERFGGVDVLYNNAGIFGIKRLADVSRADLYDYFNLMAGYFTMTQLAVAEMRKRGGGSIVNIGSIWAMQGVAATPSSVPAMAKGGIHALSRSLAIELAPEKIRVNVIAPAVVETPLFDGVATADEMTYFNAFHPLGRNGQAPDITAAFLFLADEAQSGWITGVILPVDGGVTAGRNA
jgi:NAD(P)-dependent dehydrogenase (short-subunit alcohol dehydrogenase family)